MISRLRLSVCVAIYNGEEFLRDQLSSILEQIDVFDEVIVVDDCSVDRSEEIIREFNDPRIRYFKNEKNIGVVRTFERALNEARAQFIFLSDQDDIWLPSKVSRTMQVFEQSDALCVLSDAIIVDENNMSLERTFFEWRSPRPGLLRNWAKNSFIGCAMAFRSELRSAALPFPSGIYMHDQWLGLMATLCGSVEFLPEPLIRYRRHGGNQTEMKRSPLSLMLRRRLLLLTVFTVRCVRLIGSGGIRSLRNRQ